MKPPTFSVLVNTEIVVYIYIGKWGKSIMKNIKFVETGRYANVCVIPTVVDEIGNKAVVKVVSTSHQSFEDLNGRSLTIPSLVPWGNLSLHTGAPEGLSYSFAGYAQIEERDVENKFEINLLLSFDAEADSVTVLFATPAHFLHKLVKQRERRAYQAHHDRDRQLLETITGLKRIFGDSDEGGDGGFPDCRTSRRRHQRAGRATR